MKIIKFKFSIGEKVKQGRGEGVIVGNAVIGETANNFKKKCLVRVGKKEKWFLQSVLIAANPDTKTCAKTAFQPMAVKIAVKIADNGRLTTTELVEIVKSPRTSVSTYLSRLRTEGVIESNRDVTFRKKINHSLTTYGREWLDQRYFEAEREAARPKDEDFYTYTPNEEEAEPDNDGKKQAQLEF